MGNIISIVSHHILPISRPGQDTPKDYLNTAWDAVIDPWRRGAGSYRLPLVI